MAGLHGTVDRWFDRDGRQRTDLDLGPLKQSRAYAPGVAWRTTFSDQVEDTPTGEAEGDRREILLDFVDVLRGRSGARASLIGQEVRDGRRWSVARVSFGDGATYDAFVEPATGKLDGWRITENGEPRFQGVGHWRWVDGVRMPFLETKRTDAPSADTQVRLNVVEIGAPPPTQRLVQPAGRRLAVLGGRTATDWIDFDFYQNAIIFIPGRVNGRKVPVLSDTDASISVIDKAFARRLGLRPRGSVLAAGAGGLAAAGLIGGIKVELPGLTVDGLTVEAFDLKSIADRAGHAIHRRHPIVATLLSDQSYRYRLYADVVNYRCDIRHHTLSG